MPPVLRLGARAASGRDVMSWQLSNLLYCRRYAVSSFALRICVGD